MKFSLTWSFVIKGIRIYLLFSNVRNWSRYLVLKYRFEYNVEYLENTHFRGCARNYEKHILDQLIASFYNAGDREPIQLTFSERRVLLYLILTKISPNQFALPEMADNRFWAFYRGNIPLLRLLNR